MRDLESKAIDLLEKLEKLSEQYAPETLDAALAAIQITAVGDILNGLLALGLVLLLRKPFIKIVASIKDSDGYDQSDTELGVIIFTALTALIVTPFTIYGICSLFDVWNYVSVIDPKLGLAHKIMGL